MKTLLALLLLTACHALAEDVTLRDGSVLKNVHVTGSTPGYITVTHDAGSGKILLEKLPAAWQVKYGYDAAKAQAWLAEQQAKAKEAEDAASVATEELKRLEASRVLVIGVLLRKEGDVWMVDCGEETTPQRAERNAGGFVENKPAPMPTRADGSPAPVVDPAKEKMAHGIVALSNFTPPEDGTKVVNLRAYPVKTDGGSNAYSATPPPKVEKKP